MAKVIMVQGTTSNAGKSLITAGLCRIFHQDGLRVAPFKSQNMALNSFVTRDGLEMGRAQVMQAEAAGIPPAVEMNPILLKPTTDTGSQVIVMGEVLGNMGAREYFAYKPSLIPTIQKAYDSLAAQYDVIVIEGAGSPAEINLRENDIVNMGLAELVDAPVLLVADIDRGGVFASLAGTLLLLEEEEKARVKGLIINKFRGDKTLLDPGLLSITARTGKPVVGVVPYLTLDLEDEDSLSTRLTAKTAPALLDIAVIHLPRISNFTDFNPLEAIPGVGLRYVKSPLELGSPDLVILPGTKNTMEDLLWLRQSGMEGVILRHAEAGGAVIGICGGYQMLGEKLTDLFGIEHGGTLRGMGLLPAVTVFSRKKTRTQVEGRMGTVSGILRGLSEVPLTGYEIHMGNTIPTKESPSLLTLTRVLGKNTARPDGLSVGNVYGCYIHGLFEAQAVTEGLISSLLKAKGLPLDTLPQKSFQAHKEEQYNKLAAALRKHLDLPAIYKILEKTQ